MISTDQRRLVQETFAVIAPIADDAAVLFYRRLFEIAPELEAGMFRGADMAAQRKKLMQTMALAVKSLERPEALVPVLQDLGRTHLAYGVRDEHYDSVAAALLWTLEKGLGPRFTREARDAWTAVYSLVAATMKDAARSRAA